MAIRFLGIGKAGCDAITHTVPDEFHSASVRALNNDLTVLSDASGSKTFLIPDELLEQVIQGIADLIASNDEISFGFAEISTVLKESGSAMIGFGKADGDCRAIRAAREAIASPFDDMCIGRARRVAIHISGNAMLTLPEIQEVVDFIIKSADPGADVFIGKSIDKGLRDSVRVMVIAGFS